MPTPVGTRASISHPRKSIARDEIVRSEENAGQITIIALQINTHPPTFSAFVEKPNPPRGIYTQMAGQARATLRFGTRISPRQTAQGRYLLSDRRVIQTPAWGNQYNKWVTNPEHSFSWPGCSHQFLCHAALATAGAQVALDQKTHPHTLWSPGHPPRFSSPGSLRHRCF